MCPTHSCSLLFPWAAFGARAGWRAGRDLSRSAPCGGRGLTRAGGVAKPTTGASSSPSQSGAAQSGRVGHVTSEWFRPPLCRYHLCQSQGDVLLLFGKQSIYFGPFCVEIVWSNSLSRQSQTLPLKWYFPFRPPPTQ